MTEDPLFNRRVAGIAVTLWLLVMLALLTIGFTYSPATAERAVYCTWNPSKPTSNCYPDRAIPLVDREALAAHADSAGVARGAAYALAWMESRDGRKGNAYRGPGKIVVDTTKPPVVVLRCRFLDLCLDELEFPTKRVCREVGRMQINPCARLEKWNPRCAYKRVRDNIDDNYACGLWYYRTLHDKHGSAKKAFSRYNGGNPLYAKDALAQAGEWWFEGLLTEEDR